MAVPQELVDGLGNVSYQLREKAEQDLTLWVQRNGKKGLDELSELKKKSQSPEVQSRLNNVISSFAMYEAIPGTRGYMGISMEPLLGALGIIRVIPNTPAAKSELQPNDKIIEIDGIDLSKKNDREDEAMTFVQSYVKSKKSGEMLTLKIERNGKKISKILKLADYYQLQARKDPFGRFGDGGIKIQPIPIKGWAGRGLRGDIDKDPLLEKQIPDPMQRLEFKIRQPKLLPANPELPPAIKDRRTEK